jgi:hypothetical protein
MENGIISKYPLDFDELQKGDTLTSERLTEVTGKKPKTDEYRFAILGLQALIHERTDLVAKIQSDGSIRILTDPEASDHNDKLHLQGKRMMIVRHHMMSRVDIDNLTDGQRKRHDQRVMLQSRYVTALAREAKQIRIEGQKHKQLKVEENDE